MFLKKTWVFQIPVDKGSTYPHIYNYLEKNEEQSSPTV